MQKTAEAVSLGHPDKIADYISCYILDRLLEQDSYVKYAVEVMIKDNTVVLGGEVSGRINLSEINKFVHDALCEIGYDERYASIWKHYALDINKLSVINLVGAQSTQIGMGVAQNGWGDQGVFVGYACQGDGLINRELFLARKLNVALYNIARKSDNFGLDIKTQITLSDNGDIDTAIVAIPMLNPVNIDDFIVDILATRPNQIIVNGTGAYQYHSSIADCGLTGRKLACDFYSTASAIGGGSPWTKDGSKADLTLNIYARKLAVDNLGDNDECFVYLSSCIGKSELPNISIRFIKNGKITESNLNCNMLSPSQMIEQLHLNKPIFTKLCKNGITNWDL